MGSDVAGLVSYKLYRGRRMLTRPVVPVSQCDLGVRVASARLDSGLERPFVPTVPVWAPAVASTLHSSRLRLLSVPCHYNARWSSINTVCGMRTIST